MVPGSAKRFRWPQPGDPDVYRLRTEIQEGAPGLFLLYLTTGVGVLVEAYYPDEWKPSQVGHIEKYTRSEIANGRLGAMGIRFFIFNGFDSGEYGVPVPLEEGSNGTTIKMKRGNVFAEVRRNNRNARSELKRAYDRYAWELEEGDLQTAAERGAEDRLDDAFQNAVRETEKQMGKKRGSLISL